MSSLEKEILSKLTVLKYRNVWLLYHDHHNDTVSHSDVDQKPKCVCYIEGHLVYEDEDWVKLCHAVAGIGDKDEEWEVTMIRKVDIITMKSIGET